MLFVKASVTNFVITKVCPEILTKKFTSHRIGSQKLSRTYTKAKTFPLIRTVIQVSNQASSLLSHFVAVSTKLQQLQKKTKCHATEMSPKILNHIFRRPKTSCKKLEKNFRTG